MSEIQFFGEVDKTKDGRNASEMPSWFHDVHLEKMEEEVSQKKRMLTQGRVPQDNIFMIQNEIKADEQKILEIKKSKPKLIGGQKDMVYKEYLSVGQQIADAMPTKRDELNGFANPRDELIKNNTPGLTLRDNALGTAARGLGFTALRTDKFADHRVSIKTPEELGVPKWQGTPEENFHMLRAAMTFFGAANIGAAELDTHHKKLIGLYGDNISQTYWPFGSSPKWPPPDTVTQPIQFADQPVFSFDESKGLTKIPANIPLWSVAYSVPQSHELMRTTPASGLFAAANITRYRLRENLRLSTQSFLRMLGYQMMYDDPYRGIPGNAGAVLTGLTENSRHSLMSISPEHGSTVGIYDMMTDLPLEHTKPIDAGIWRFCKSCGVCAKFCPPGSIEPKGGREPSWEPYTTSVTPKFPELPGYGFGTEPETAKLGRKTYWTDMISCQLFARALPNRCQLCFGVCTFNAQYAAMVHDVIRSTASVTPLFNSFFASMGENFGYGLKEGEEKEEWWDMNLPAYGYSTGFYSEHGGYNRAR